MKGRLKDRGFKKIFIIGAGFSAPLGMPLAKDILKDIYKVSLSKPWVTEETHNLYGQAHLLVETLNYYFPLDNFTHTDILNGKYDAMFDIEKFLSYACADSAFGEKWDEHGDQFLSLVKGWIAEVIFKTQEKSLSGPIPSQYLVIY